VTINVGKREKFMAAILLHKTSQSRYLCI